MKILALVLIMISTPIAFAGNDISHFKLDKEKEISNFLLKAPKIMASLNAMKLVEGLSWLKLRGVYFSGQEIEVLSGYECHYKVSLQLEKPSVMSQDGIGISLHHWEFFSKSKCPLKSDYRK